MKKILVAVLVIGALYCAAYYEHNYTRENCTVVQVNDGWATIEDKCGFTWDYEDSNLNVGNVVDLKMHDHNTSAYIGDDVVKSVVLKGNANIVLRAGK